jgi:hypothetical protein
MQLHPLMVVVPIALLAALLVIALRRGWVGKRPAAKPKPRPEVCHDTALPPGMFEARRPDPLADASVDDLAMAIELKTLRVRRDDREFRALQLEDELRRTREHAALEEIGATFATLKNAITPTNPPT